MIIFKNNVVKCPPGSRLFQNRLARLKKKRKSLQQAVNKKKIDTSPGSVRSRFEQPSPHGPDIFNETKT